MAAVVMHEVVGLGRPLGAEALYDFNNVAGRCVRVAETLPLHQAADVTPRKRMFTLRFTEESKASHSTM